MSEKKFSTEQLAGPKPAMTVSVSKELQAAYREMAKTLNLGPRKLGLLFSAALLMYLEADPEDQQQCFERVVLADTKTGFKAVIEKAKADQYEKIAARERDAPSKRKGSRGSDNPASGAA